jgi:hypothetical protein
MMEIQEQCESGQTLCYQTIKGHDNEVKVTGWIEEAPKPYTPVSYRLVIPASIMHNGTIYAVTVIGKKAFAKACFDEVIINGQLTDIEEMAFAVCHWLERVEITGSVTRIGEYAFGGCQLLQEVVLKSGLTEIGENAFSYCSCLTGISLPDSLKTIRQTAFYHSGLRSVSLPDSTCMEEGAFGYCEQLKGITVSPNHQKYKIDEGVLYSKDGQLLHCPCHKTGVFNVPAYVNGISGYAFDHCGQLSALNIPESVTKIGPDAFSGCTQLISMRLPASVSEVGKEAFQDCLSLKEVTLPSCLKTIEQKTFWGCQNLESVQLAEGLESIRNKAFQRCFKLDSLIIPASVRLIEPFAFVDSCNRLKLQVAEGSACYQSINGKLYDLNGKLVRLRHCLSAERKKAKKAVPPVRMGKKMKKEGLTYQWTADGSGLVLTDWLKRQHSLTNLDTRTTSIAAAPFEDRPVNLLAIPPALDQCGEWRTSEEWKSGVYGVTAARIEVAEGNPYYKMINGLLCSCDGTKMYRCPTDATGEVRVPDSVTTIVPGAFDFCNKVTSITLPEFVQDIDNLFDIAECSQLTDIHVMGHRGEYRSANGILYGHQGKLLAFAPRHKWEEEITVAEGCLKIKDFAILFAKTRRLVLPTSLRMLPIYGPSPLDAALDTIVCKAALPPAFSDDFDYKEKFNITVLVPAASVSLYREDKRWRLFKEIKAL